MTDLERHAAARDAVSNTVNHSGPTPERYHSALQKYLAALSNTNEPTHHPEPSHHMPWWRLGDISVRDVMTKDVVSVRDDASFKDLVRALADVKISALPVVDGGGLVVGVVSKTDLVARVIADTGTGGRPPGGHSARRAIRTKATAETAGELMTAPPVTVHSYETIVDAARTAAKAHVRRLPVVDDRGVLIGIVTRSDLINVFLRDDADIHDHIVDEVITRWSGTDPASIHVAVRDGIVTLTGQLERRGLIRPLLDSVRAVAGVVSVHDHLSYRFDDSIFPPPQFSTLI